MKASELKPTSIFRLKAQPEANSSVIRFCCGESDVFLETPMTYECIVKHRIYSLNFARGMSYKVLIGKWIKNHCFTYSIEMFLILLSSKYSGAISCTRPLFHAGMWDCKESTHFDMYLLCCL